MSKKKIDDALNELVRTGRTSHAFILDVSMARLINQQSGGAVIAPWEVRDLGEDELEVFRALSMDLPERREFEKKKEQVFADVRKRHPSYRKY